MKNDPDRARSISVDGSNGLCGSGSPGSGLDDMGKEMNTKDTNPKDAVGIRKVPVSTIPAPVMSEVGLALLEGARKYGRHNYRVAGIRFSVYYDATIRHLMAWWEGEDIDPDSGLSHITKAIAGLTVLRDAMLNDKVTDDRPPKSKAGWIDGLNERAGAIIDKYPDAKEPHLAHQGNLTATEVQERTRPSLRTYIATHGHCICRECGAEVKGNLFVDDWGWFFCCVNHHKEFYDKEEKKNAD